MSIIKKLREFNTEQLEKLNFEQHSIDFNGNEYRIEAISSDEKLNPGSNVELLSTVAIYQENSDPEKMIFHEVFVDKLTEEQLESSIQNIVSNPSKYINQ